MNTVGPWRQTQCGLSARSCSFWLLSWGCNVFAEAHGHHGYASSSRLVDMCNWCGCSITRQGAGTAGSSASKSGETENCPGTLLSHGYLPYSVASDSKLLETSRSLGTGGPYFLPHSRPAGRDGARVGEKVWNVRPHTFSVHIVLETLFYTQIWSYTVECQVRVSWLLGLARAGSQRIVASVEPESEPKKGLNEPLTVILN